MKNYIIHTPTSRAYHDVRRAFNGKHPCLPNQKGKVVTSYEGRPTDKQPCKMCFQQFRARYNGPDTPYQEVLP